MSETETTTITLPRLRVDAIDSAPVSYEFGEGYGESWDFWEAITCDDCGQPVLYEYEHGVIATNEEGDDLVRMNPRGYAEAETYATEDDANEAGFEFTRPCANEGRDARDMDAEGPMMSYYYPLDVDDNAEAARLLVDTPLVVVEVGDQTGLALSGGGMDLTWEICEAFLALGFYPPVHFCDLPGMAKEDSPENRMIVAACRESVRIKQRWLARTLERLDQAEAELRQY